MIGNENFNVRRYIVGAFGREFIKTRLKYIKEIYGIDFVVANAENSAGVFGITREVAMELLNAWIDVLTLGDHTWDRKDTASWIGDFPNVIRPANFADLCPGRGYGIYPKLNKRIVIINLIGRVFMKPCECPFKKIDSLLSEVTPADIVLVDFHAEATSEKKALGRYVDGKVTCVAGSHTHVQTADECILPRGTAYVTDMGMCGSADSVIGRDTESVIKMFLTGMLVPFKVAKEHPVIEGVIITVDNLSDRVLSIERMRDKK